MYFVAAFFLLVILGLKRKEKCVGCLNDWCKKKSQQIGESAGLPSNHLKGRASMTSTNNTIFDEIAYRNDLIKAGLESSVASEVAANMARIRNEAPTQVLEVDKVDSASESIIELPPAPRKGGNATKTPKSSSLAAATQLTPVFDYRNGELPARVRDLIETHLAIEAQDAKSAGSLGFMTRSLAIATLPHRKTSDFRFVRRNGDFTLTMMTAHPQGLPYGTLPRLLLTWVCTEVAQKRERVLSLGNNLSSYLTELGLHNTGGKRGDITRLKHAMTTLFSSVISCHYDGKDSFDLQNVLLADRVKWWTPQNPEEAGEWQSSVQLSEPFYRECIEHTLPFDMRAIKVLRGSPLALDIYIWLTYRMSYLSRRTIIPWVALAGQFGSGYSLSEQGLRDFKRAFLRELKHVLVIYPAARVSNGKTGLVLYPSATHIAPTQLTLF